MPACLVTKNDTLQIHTIGSLLGIFKSYTEFPINSMLRIHLWRPHISIPLLYGYVHSRERNLKRMSTDAQNTHQWQEGKSIPEFWKQRYSRRSPLGMLAFLMRSWCLIQRNDTIWKALRKSKQATNINSSEKKEAFMENVIREKGHSGTKKKKDADTVHPLHCTDLKNNYF